MWRLVPILLAFTAVDSVKLGTSRLFSPDAWVATSFMDELRKDPLYPLNAKEAMERRIKFERLDKKGLIRGLSELLRSGIPEQKPQAARLLGMLGDSSAFTALFQALNDPDENLRLATFFALESLDAKGELVESALVKLRREDPSVDVRVAAADVLKRPTDPEAVAAFELGARTTKRGWIRQICEDELEKLGKLQLPLPEEVYKEINLKEYEDLRAYFRSKFRREVRKGDSIYFEVEEGRPHGLSFYGWYRMKLMHGNQN